MKWLHRSFALLGVFCLCVSLSVTSFAVSDASFSVYDFDSVVDEDFIFEVEDELLESSSVLEEFIASGEALPVTIIEEEAGYSVRAGSAGTPLVIVGDEPPSDSLFYGSGWISGYDSNLGNITLYFPANYKTGYWGIDSNGYLYNISSSSLSGYLDGVYNNSVSAPAFSYPRYRESGSSSYNYINIYLKPENSNMHIATEHMPLYDVSDFQPYILFLIGGALFLCFMKRS